VALLIDGVWLTPVLSCGLLPGIGRQVALQRGELQEAVLTLNDLQRASQVMFVNSLRGKLLATVVHPHA
jgi:para-aminobenzoate synthetase/4-amino-4-deoxychorismate lyase